MDVPPGEQVDRGGTVWHDNNESKIPQNYNWYKSQCVPSKYFTTTISPVPPRALPSQPAGKDTAPSL